MAFFAVKCASPETSDKKSFPVINVNENEWATYEGRWSTKEAILRIELSLKVGAFGYDSDYRLIEFYDTKNSSTSSKSQGKYSTQYNRPDNELAITLHEINQFSKGSFLRFNKLATGKNSEEMYFITRGNNELLPCDADYKILTEDKRFTLHKRSRLFTIEGYITFENDSAVFFERNTFEHWRVAHLGEFNELRKTYGKLAKQKYEGIYVKALAYSIIDEQAKDSLDFLVIKQTKNVGGDPDVD